MVLLHGLFGSGNNLGALARSLQDRYEVHSVDLPNHGRSGWVEEADLSTMARNLHDWNYLVDKLGIRRVNASPFAAGGKRKIGLGRAIDATRLIEVLRHGKTTKPNQD